jgi:hypothetical protein
MYKTKMDFDKNTIMIITAIMIIALISQFMGWFTISDIKMPNVQLPSVNMPSVHLPSVNMPDVNLPKISLPNLCPVNNKKENYQANLTGGRGIEGRGLKDHNLIPSGYDDGDENYYLK